MFIKYICKMNVVCVACYRLFKLMPSPVIQIVSITIKINELLIAVQLV